MRRIRKFNESAESDITKYLNNAFKKYTRSGAEVNYGDDYWEIYIDEPKSKAPISMNEYVNNTNKISDFAKNVSEILDNAKKEPSIKKVSFDYLAIKKCIYLKFRLK